MKNKIRGSVICFLMLCVVSNAQKSEIKNAKNSFNQGSYAETITKYKHLISNGNTSEEVYQSLGDAYYYSANYTAAATWYTMLFKLDTVTVSDECIFRFATSLKSLGEYEKSDLWMVKFSKRNPLDSRAKKFLDRPDYLQRISDYSERVTIKNMTLNSYVSDFAPSLSENQLIFSSARDSGLISNTRNRRGNKPFHKLYVANLTTPLKVVKFSKQLDTKASETTTAFSKDGKTMYFTRNSFKKGNFSRDKDGFSRAKIYRARFKNSEWSDIEELSFNSDGYSVAHPALSPDEKKLYFASDMLGTFGLSDIFSVEVHDDGSFGSPINLGPEINTAGRDTFPFISASNRLYFASDGQVGLGGLDIFVTLLDGKEQSCVVNVGKPINSKEDDFSFILDEEHKVGYFTSNREGGQGSDDIYSFNETTPLLIKCAERIKGLVTNAENGKTIANSNITVFNNSFKIIGETVSDHNGRFELDVSYRSGTYQIHTKKKGFKGREERFTMALDRFNTNFTLKMTELSAVAGTDLVEYLKIDPILFDLNEHVLTLVGEKSVAIIAAYMLRFPQMHLKIHAFTDASGTTSYNQLLSEKRAKSTIVFLLQLGVKATNVTYKGFGETRLLQDCNDKEPCSVEEHQKNRRSECIVTNK